MSDASAGGGASRIVPAGGALVGYLPLGFPDLETSIGFGSREEEFMRQFFLDRVAEESILSGQSFMYLHYADMIANGYHRTMPCPFQRQGLLLNPNGELFYCENSA